jgi:hypothetical protein
MLASTPPPALLAASPAPLAAPCAGTRLLDRSHALREDQRPAPGPEHHDPARPAGNQRSVALVMSGGVLDVRPDPAAPTTPSRSTCSTWMVARSRPVSQPASRWASARTFCPRRYMSRATPPAGFCCMTRTAPMSKLWVTRTCAIRCLLSEESGGPGRRSTPGPAAARPQGDHRGLGSAGGPLLPFAPPPGTSPGDGDVDGLASSARGYRPAQWKSQPRRTVLPPIT